MTTREFDQGNCQIHYQILPQYLHVGRNFGSVRIRSLRQEFVFPVEVIKKMFREQMEERKNSR